MAAPTVVCCSLLLLFVVSLPSGTVDGHTLEEIVQFFNTIENVAKTIGEETVILDQKETRVVEMLGTVSDLLTKHAQEATLKMKVGTSCRSMRTTMALTQIGSMILDQLKDIITKVMKLAALDIQKRGQDCAKIATSHTESAKGEFNEKFGAELKEHMVGKVVPEEKAVAKTGKYTTNFGNTMVKTYEETAVEECIKSVSEQSVRRLFDALLEQELDPAVEVTVEEPADQALYKLAAANGAKNAALAMLQSEMVKLLSGIKHIYDHIYPFMLIFHEAMLKNLDTMDATKNTNLQKPSLAIGELKKQSETAYNLYVNVCIGKTIDPKTIYLPLGEVDLKELLKEEKIPTKTLMGYQEKIMAKSLAEIEILPMSWSSPKPE